MFNKKDYKAYFKQLYQVEINMKKEGESLLKIVSNPRAKKLLEKLVSDEVRHAKIVKEMMELI